MGVFSKSLRDRVAEEIEHFNAAFSATENDETSANLEDLAAAADRLMRAVGRVLIEVKRELVSPTPESKAQSYSAEQQTA